MSGDVWDICPECSEFVEIGTPCTGCGVRMDGEVPIGTITEGTAQGDEGRKPPQTRLEALRADIITADQLDSIGDPDPLIGPNILFRDSLAWLIGKPGCYKSFVALDMAGSIATGTQWHDWTTTQGPVLYLVAEGLTGIRKRVRAWEKATGQDMTGVDFLRRPVQAGDDAEWDALVVHTKQRGYALIILDTQARITVGMEENSNKEMGRFVEQAERLRIASGACVLVIHHIGHNGDTGRGATTLPGAMNTIIKVTKEQDGAQAKLECTKNKDSEEWKAITLRIVPSGESVVLAYDGGGIKAATQTGPTKAAMTAAQTWWDTAESRWLGKTDLLTILDVSATTFYRHINDLKKAGLVEEDDTAKWSTWRLTRDPRWAT